MTIAGAARLSAAVALLAFAAAAAGAEPVAEAFGAREGVEQVSLSPDGTRIAFLAPAAGQGSTLFTISTADPAAQPKAALAANGAPDRLSDCQWVSDARLVCTVWGKAKVPEFDRPLTYTQIVAVDADGRNQKLLQTKSLNARRATAFGGAVIDWLPGTDGQMLMMRDHQRTDQTGTNIGDRREGIGVDRVDSRTLRTQPVEAPRQDAIEYITDGLGNVRVAGFWQRQGETWQSSGATIYRYRATNGSDWKELGKYDEVTREGFNPYAVDADQNVVYGFRKVDGRLALFTKALDGSGTETLVYARPDVDVDGLVRIGRKRRVVGVSYATDRREVVYFDPQLRALAAALGKALPRTPQISILDASADESKLLIFAGSDDDPGTYYLFDQATKKLQVLMQKRPQLADRTLASIRSVTVRTRDGVLIPAYLTLPPGGATKGLPAIVLPHGGPAARDEWGFDWLPQYFAARGYAVLQPEFRGSEGYGDSFQMENGFRSWRTAVGDVVDAGRWLVAQGIADPKRLAIFGWSYGGYAALESAVMEPGLYKAVVAVAPVTDFETHKNQFRDSSNHQLMTDYVGSGDAEASPAQNAARIKVPVLLVHGTLDSNVVYGESTLMESKLRAAGGKVELITFDGLDHQIEDSAARAKLLERSDAFIRAAIGG